MEVLTCKDFSGPCCESCHEEIDSGLANDVPIEVYKELKLFATVCCRKVTQAELRRDGITEAK